jgi:hypothetical protein
VLVRGAAGRGVQAAARAACRRRRRSGAPGLRPGTHHARVPVNGVDPAVGALHQQLGQHQLLDALRRGGGGSSSGPDQGPAARGEGAALARRAVQRRNRERELAPGTHQHDAILASEAERRAATAERGAISGGRVAGDGTDRGAPGAAPCARCARARSPAVVYCLLRVVCLEHLAIGRVGGGGQVVLRAGSAARVSGRDHAGASCGRAARGPPRWRCPRGALADRIGQPGPVAAPVLTPVPMPDMLPLPQLLGGLSGRGDRWGDAAPAAPALAGPARGNGGRRSVPTGAVQHRAGGARGGLVQRGGCRVQGAAAGRAL